MGQGEQPRACGLELVDQFHGGGHLSVVPSVMTGDQPDNDRPSTEESLMSVQIVQFRECTA
ncbi:hypothetical protein GCM10027269_68190 [Kribbella endophytica]